MKKVVMIIIGVIILGVIFAYTSFFSKEVINTTDNNERIELCAKIVSYIYIYIYI